MNEIRSRKMKQNTKVFIFTNLVFLVVGLFLFNPPHMGEVAGETPSYSLDLTASDPVTVVAEAGQKTFRSVTLDYAGVAQASGYHVQFTSDYGGIIYNNESNPITGIKNIAVVFSGTGSLTLKTGASFNNYYTEQEYFSSFNQSFTRSPCFFTLESFADMTINITSVTITYSCVAPMDGVVYTLNGDHYEVTDYTGNPDMITIPVTYEGLPVTVIGNGAFYKSNISSILLPEGLTTIGAFAFRSCQRLMSIYIPSTVTSIGNYAFEMCVAMTNVNFAPSSSLTSIGGYAFSNCGILMEIFLPEGIVEIPANTFYADGSLTKILIPVSVRTVWDNAFEYCDLITSVFYGGNATQWGMVSRFSGNDYLWNATRYYYSETPASGTWRYVDGNPVLWS